MKDYENGSSYKNILHRLTTLIKELDFYSITPNFKVKRLDNFKTGFGSFLSILTILFTLVAFIYFYILLLDDKSPRLLFSLMNDFNPPLTTLNLNNYGFGFSLQNPFTYDQFIDESIYHPLVFQMTGTRVVKGNATVFEWSVVPEELVPCNINKFPKSYHDIMKDLPFKDYYCMKDPSFNIAGTFLNKEYKYLMIKLFECKNTTEIIGSNRIVDRNKLRRFLKEKDRSNAYDNENEDVDVFDFTQSEDFSFYDKGGKNFYKSENPNIIDINSNEDIFNDFIISEIQNFNKNNKYKITKVHKHNPNKNQKDKNIITSQPKFRFLTNEENPKHKHFEDLVQKFTNFKRNLAVKTQCKKKSYIDDILRGTFFSYTYTDITIDPTNYNKADQIYNGDSYTTVSNKFFKEMHHYKENIDVITDSGLVLTSKKTEKFIKTHYIKEMTDFRLADNFLSYSVKLSTRKEIYNRSYPKLQLIAAELGGVLKSINVICFIILYFYSRTKFYEHLKDFIFESKCDRNDRDYLKGLVFNDEKIKKKYLCEKSEMNLNRNSLELKNKKEELNEIKEEKKEQTDNSNLIHLRKNSNFKLKNDMNFSNENVNEDNNNNYNRSPELVNIDNESQIKKIHKFKYKKNDENLRSENNMISVNNLNSFNNKNNENENIENNEINDNDLNEIDNSNKNIVNNNIKFDSFAAVEKSNNNNNNKIIKKPSNNEIKEKKGKINIEKKNSRKKIEDEKILNSNNNPNSNEFGVDNFQKFVNRKKRTYKLNFIETLFLPCIPCRKKKAFKIIDIVKDKSDDMLDIVRYIRELIDFKRLKRIMFNSNELFLFEYPFRMQIKDEVVENPFNHNDEENSFDKNIKHSKSIVKFKKLETSNIDSMDAKNIYQAIKNLKNDPDRNIHLEKILKNSHSEIQNYYYFIDDIMQNQKNNSN